MTSSSRPKTKLQIVSIKCHGTSEPRGDEVFLLCQADGGVPIRYPAELIDARKMCANYDDCSSDDPCDPSSYNLWPLESPELILNFEYEVLVSLYDRDVTLDPTVSTFLACRSYKWNDLALDPPEQTIDFQSNVNGARYSVTTRKLSD